MKTTKPKILCRHCGGTGKVELTSEMFDTLKLIRKVGEATAPALHKGLYSGDNQVSVTAINNRLEDLRKWGFLARHRSGRRWIYKPTNKSC